MENQFFTWGGWDQMDTGEFVFYDVELVAGQLLELEQRKFKSIFISYTTGKMEFYSDDPEGRVLHSYQLALNAVQAS